MVSGESNGDRIADAVEYNTLFPRLISDWRQQWGQGNFPFLFVQLANFRDSAKTPSEGIWLLGARSAAESVVPAGNREWR
ncbi:hypothetical protein ACQ86N_15375 [Puia sp. P3]|uniref:hypothetical protein n=1 Tax=Puia sp. P3 TaxID=3423952 RepID=UPI003D664D05